MTEARSNQVKHPGAGIFFAALTGGVLFLVFRSPFPCGGGAGGGCDKASIFEPLVTLFVLFPFSVLLSAAVASLLVVPLALALQSFHRLGLLYLNAAMAAAGLAVALTLEGMLLSSVGFFVVWFLGIASCFWLVATRDIDW